MFKTETHLHTSNTSPCGKLNAIEMVKLYHEAGYSTVCITDHVSQSFLDGLGDISWEDKVDAIFRGYNLAKEEGEKYNINVIPSAEIMLEGTLPNHYLTYGITKEFFLDNPNICKTNIEEFYKLAKDSGVFIVQAHPFRDRHSYPTPNFIDGVEIYNSNPRHKDYSDESKKVATENGLYVTAGSDAHRIEDVALSGIITDSEIKTATDLINAIKSRKIKLIRCEL